MFERRALVVGGVAITTLLVSACGGVSAQPKVAHRVVVGASATLAQCAAQWNRAPLGTGRLWARAVAADGPPAALMVRFADGVCGLAFPASQVNKAGAVGGVFVHVLHGDYFWGIDPVNFTWPPSPSSPASASPVVEARAATGSNVRVELRTGRVEPFRGHSIAVVALPALGPAPRTCSAFRDPQAGETPPIYRVNKSTVPCPQAAEIVWAYNQQQGRLLRPSGGIRSILGWRCSGRRSPGQPTSAPPTSGRITCTRGARQIDVQASTLPHSGLFP